MKQKQPLLTMTLLSSLLIPAIASAATINLLAAQDNTIYDHGNSNSTSQGMFVGGTGIGGGGLIQRGLITFDLSAIPAGSVINSINLAIHVNALGFNSNNETITLNRLLADWGEGSTGSGGQTGGGGSGIAPSDGDATWFMNSHNVSSWANTGGDFLSTASASTMVSGVGSFTHWNGTGLVNDVQHWLDNGDNFGWILRGDEINIGSSVRFSSRENTGTVGGDSVVPVLTVDYTVVPVPAAAWLFGSGLIALVGLVRRKRG